MCSSCSDPAAAEDPANSNISPLKALLFTQNTTRNPISWNPALRQPNPNEALHSVHLALHRALDPCIAGSEETCSWSIQPDSSSTSDDKRRAAPLRILTIPRKSQLKHPSLGPSDHPEISVKLRFYGSHENVDRRRHVDEALQQLEEATGFKEIDRFLIGFDGIRWAGGDLECEDGEEEVDVLVKTGVWNHISSNASLKTIGVSDFSSCHLTRLLQQLPSAEAEGSVRRPRIDQLNFDRELPKSLAALAKAEGIQLQSHSNSRVPSEGIEVLLAEFQKQLPLPPSFAELRGKGAAAIEMHWVMKYTIILKDRGLVADKGFILSFSFKD